MLLYIYRNTAFYKLLLNRKFAARLNASADRTWKRDYLLFITNREITGMMAAIHVPG